MAHRRDWWWMPAALLLVMVWAYSSASAQQPRAVRESDRALTDRIQALRTTGDFVLLLARPGVAPSGAGESASRAVPLVYRAMASAENQADSALMEAAAALDALARSLERNVGRSGEEWRSELSSGVESIVARLESRRAARGERPPAQVVMQGAATGTCPEGMVSVGGGGCVCRPNYEPSLTSRGCVRRGSDNRPLVGCPAPDLEAERAELQRARHDIAMNAIRNMKA